MIRRMLLLLFIPTLLFSQINNWRDKTINQLSGMVSGTTDIGSKSYWETKAYNQIRDIISRLDTVRYATDFTNIDNAVASLINGGPIVCPAATYNINASSLTIPANVELIMEKGAIINGTSAKTITINGQLRAGIYQIFGDSVTVTFDTASVAVAYPEWWGLSSDSTDEAAFNAMWDALPDGRKGSIKLSGDYYFSDTWTLDEAGSDSVPQEAVHIDAYGSSIWSEADTTLLVNLGWYTQGEQIHTIEGLRIYGNGNEGGINDQDVGTNIGIYVKDVAGLRLINNAIRNCGDAIVFAHYGPGTTYTPYCDSPVILYNNLVCNNQGIVFTSTDTTDEDVGVTADFDRVRMCFNTIQIGNGADEDTLDACVVIEDSTRVSRSIFTDNFFMTTDSTNVFYINGGIGGCVIEVSAECTNGNTGMGAAVFRIGDYYEEPGSVGTEWGAYGFSAMIHQTSGNPNKLVNYTGKRFPYSEGFIRNGWLGYAFRDWSGDVPISQLRNMAATGGYTQGANLLYLFNDASADTVVSDVSGNLLEMNINTGTTRTDIDSTDWVIRSFDGVDDCMSSGLHTLDGNQMIICGFIPDSAYDVSNVSRLFKWYTNDSNMVFINHANGSSATTATIYADNDVSTDSVSLTPAIQFSAGDPLVFGVVIDTVDDVFELWVNGILEAQNDYVGNIVSTSSNFALGAEWGCASLYTAYDLCFFAVYPYINRQMMKEISKHVLAVMNSDEYAETYTQFKADDIASATTIKLLGGNVFDITGTTQIDSIDVTSPQTTGTLIYLQFDSTPQVTDGANLKLAGNLTASADDVLVLIRIGDVFYEVSRSVN